MAGEECSGSEREQSAVQLQHISDLERIRTSLPSPQANDVWATVCSHPSNQCVVIDVHSIVTSGCLRRISSGNAEVSEQRILQFWLVYR